MKQVRLTSLLCGGVLSLTGGALLAQQSATSDNSSASSASQTTQSSPGGLGASANTYSPSSSLMNSGNNVRLSQLMNSSVQSQEGKTLGHIRDLMVDPQSGRIQFAILSLSSAGGASDTATAGRETVPSSRSSTAGTPSSAIGSTSLGKLIPVPWQLFSQSWTGNRATSSSSTSTTAGSTATSSQNLVLNIDESKLRSAPSFDTSDWNQLQQGSFDQRVYSYYGVDRSASGIGTPGASIRGQGASGSTPDSSNRDRSNNPSVPQGSTSPDK